MAQSDASNSTAFLVAVRQQLRALEPAEQREILDELTTHLRDAVTDRTAEANEAADADVVRAMGDPTIIGQRLRDEHLQRRLSLRDALLTALPLVLFALLFSQTGMRLFLRSLSNGGNGFPASFLVALAPFASVGVWLLVRTRQSWPATVLGGIGVLGLLGITHTDGMVSHGPLGLIWLMLITLAVIPLTLGFALRWGSFRATLAILGGVGAYGYYAWSGGGQLGPSLAISLCPILGVIALGLTPRRWQLLTTWAVFGLNWLIIVLDAFYYQHFYRAQYLLELKAQPGYSPFATYHIPPMHVINLVSSMFLVGSAALLLSVQVFIRLQASSRLPRRLRWVS
jgi:hypothetical protein